MCTAFITLFSFHRAAASSQIPGFGS